MSILAIDTATQVSSVAVASEARLSAELTMQARLTHSETLLPHMEQVLKMANVKKEDLDGIAVSMGPGSFTGLRIGLAAAKAVCYALKLPLIGVPTLEAMAWHYPVPGVRIVTLLDAQKGNAYRQSFRFHEGRMEAQEEITVSGLPEVISYCGEMKEPVVLLGDVVPKKIAGKLELPANVSLAPAHLVMPRAACVAMVGLKKLAAGEVGNVMDMEPVYIRRSEAEVLWEKRHPEAAEGSAK
ncbi:MAG: tRNA (adenosine(37)-N6)-threonylcarbamoyltransferase complex dimerization subunit type 1 TsaB [Selenomonas sp.]|nr:tRNA (adenosine(37)-N6)-threonylcarbamoyltransferase complex dimerization subunit type 1 TsaB [Selenomonas sp.]